MGPGSLRPGEAGQGGESQLALDYDAPPPPSTAWSSAAFAAFTPRPRISVSAWADQYRVIPAGTSPEPDRWRTSRVPYLREPMDAVSDPEVERVVFQAASQVGKSELVLNVIGYYAHQDPAPILIVQPTETAAGAFSKERIEPTFRATPALRGKLSESQRDKNNTILLKQFPGGMLACAWATSPVSLASRPIRVALLDEIDRYPDSVGRDGDPIEQAIQRTSNFHNRKIVLVSTPTIEGLSAIARQYEESDQRRYWVPCPRCGSLQVMTWSNVVYKNECGENDSANAYYRCEHCGDPILERDRPAMVAAGEWRPDNPGHPTRGYQISALYSPWQRWSELAAQWIKVNRERDKRGLQEFINLKLGETWTETATAVTVEALEDNREEYDAEVPDGALLLTCGCDIQDNRIEALVTGWGAGKESWGIEYRVLPGDTSAPDVWLRLDEFLAKTWARGDGGRMGIWCTLVDSSGHRTQETYEFARTRLRRNIFPCKGKAGEGQQIIGKPSLTNRLRVPLYLVGVDVAKSTIYSRLLLTEEGPGYCHFPTDAARGFDAEFFRGLCSEKRVVKVRAGRKAAAWVQTRDRNEPLDCSVYALAAMELLNPDFARLAGRLERAAGGGKAGKVKPAGKVAVARAASSAANPAPTGGNPTPAASVLAPTSGRPAPRRRVLSRGVQL